MKFMDEVIKQSLPVWDECIETAFLVKMVDGSLTRKMFADYMVQDSLYLRDYQRTFAFGIAKSPTIREMKLFYPLLSDLAEGADQMRIQYLSDAGIDDADIDRMPKYRQCHNYTEYLLKIGRGGNIEDIIMAILPCMLGYYYVFEKIVAQHPSLLEGYYGPMVSCYSSERFRVKGEYWKEVTNELCESLDNDRKRELANIFYQGSLHELWFWEMAGEEH